MLSLGDAKEAIVGTHAQSVVNIELGIQNPESLSFHHGHPHAKNAKREEAPSLLKKERKKVNSFQMKYHLQVR